VRSAEEEEEAGEGRGAVGVMEREGRRGGERAALMYATKGEETAKGEVGVVGREAAQSRKFRPTDRGQGEALWR
jgi:hypothetical protein